MHALAIAVANEEKPFTLEMRRRLSAAFPAALKHLRAHGCGTLKLGAWGVLIAILGPMGGGIGQHESWLGQVTQGARAGCSDRTVRRHVPKLLAGGFLRQRREPRGQAAGRRHDKLFYRPGPVLLAALETFVGGRAKHLHPVDRSPDNLTDRSPDKVTTEPEKPRILELLASDTPPPHVAAALAAELVAAPAAPDSVHVVEEEVFKGGGGENLAREVLATRYTRAFPAMRAPAADPAELLQVLACLRLVPEANRELAIRDALEGAWLSNRSPRAPSVRFIFGSPDYFASHVEVGRLARERAAAAARRRALPVALVDDAQPVLTPEETQAAIAAAIAKLDGDA